MKLTQLKDKLLLGAVAISFLVALASMLAASWVIRQQYLDQSNALLRKASSVIDDSLADRRNNLLTTARQLATQKNLGSTIWYLTQYVQSDVDRETLLNTYQQLTRDTYKVGRVAKLSKIAIYDSAGSLVSFALFDSGSELVGFIERFDTPLFQVAALEDGEELNRQALRTTNSVAKISLNFGGRLPQQESVHYAVVDGLLAIESHVPIMGEAFDPSTGKQEIKQLGLVATVQSLDQSFVDHISRLTDVKINVFTPQGFSRGGVAAYLNPDWGSVQAGPDGQLPAITFNEIMIEGVGFYQSLIPLYTDKHLIGTIAALHSKEIVRKNTREMIMILGLIAAASLLLIFPFAWYFATSISHPLTVLSRVFRGVASGKQIGTLSVELGHLEKEKNRRDELGDLTQSFIAMDDAVNQKIQQINEINASLEHKVEERTAELKRIAHYDALTGIPNRVLLADRIKQAIAQAKREQKMLGVCYLDLDGFKPVNDTLGHQAGDHVLIEIAQRIGTILREADTIARLGGDEFVVLLPDLNHEEECISTLKRLLEVVSQPVFIQDHSFPLTASIGVSIFPGDDNDPDVLLRHADQAMYVAKQSGKNRYHLFDPSHDRQTRAYHATISRIQQGLDNHEFELYYQPNVNLSTRQVFGAEALIRWNHPERGLLLPSEFLSDIRDSALEIRLGEWVIGTALDQLMQWCLEGFAMDVSVNIVACHLQSEGFVEYLERTFAGYPNLPPGRLHIEILETAALEDFAAISTTMEACRMMGVRFALDDFGTGYSSLSYLQRLPIDTLKIDQSFVRDMLVDKGDNAIVHGIIVLANAFGLKTVAEGIETLEQFDALLAMGCESGQGHVIAQPMPASDFVTTVRRFFDTN